MRVREKKLDGIPGGRREGEKKNERWVGERRADERGSVSNCVPRERKVEENRGAVWGKKLGERMGKTTRLNENSGIAGVAYREAGREARNESHPLAEFTAFSSERAEPLIPSTSGFQLATLIPDSRDRIPPRLSSRLSSQDIASIFRGENFISNVHQMFTEKFEIMFLVYFQITRQRIYLLFSLFKFFFHTRMLSFSFRKRNMSRSFPRYPPFQKH